MNIKKVILCGVIMWVAGSLFSWLTCGWLFRWVYEIPPIISKSPEEIMLAKNLLGSNVISLIGAILFALVFAILYKGIPGAGVKKGITYGFLLWLVGGLSGMAVLPFFTTIATTVVVYWIIQALVIDLIYGLILGAVYKEKK